MLKNIGVSWCNPFAGYEAPGWLFVLFVIVGDFCRNFPTVFMGCEQKFRFRHSAAHGGEKFCHCGGLFFIQILQRFCGELGELDIQFCVAPLDGFHVILRFVLSFTMIIVYTHFYYCQAFIFGG